MKRDSYQLLAYTHTHMNTCTYTEHAHIHTMMLKITSVAILVDRY